MTQRLKSLNRIEAVQKRLVALAEFRLIAAEQLCRNIAEDQARLRDFVAGDPLSHPLAKATLRATHTIDRRLIHAKSLRDRQKEHRDALKRREHAVSTMVDSEKVHARRVAEDSDLAEVLEAWLALQSASLP